MAKIVLISDDCMCRSAYLETCLLPEFYMEDFSIQGLVVRQYNDARNLFLRAGVTLLDKRIGSDIIIDQAEQPGAIRSLFEQNGIQTESDWVTSLYRLPFLLRGGVLTPGISLLGKITDDAKSFFTGIYDRVNIEVFF